mmetsp:Transcript_5033/g.10396  ORF Transcript_5033/g.10396 Transcript_5033/m.10396 type:complete len:118 (-) Transcript_5033:447-800(-)
MNHTEVFFVFGNLLLVPFGTDDGGPASHFFSLLFQISFCEESCYDNDTTLVVSASTFVYRRSQTCLKQKRWFPAAFGNFWALLMLRNTQHQSSRRTERAGRGTTTSHGFDSHLCIRD